MNLHDDWAGALVILHDGKRLSWKVKRATVPEIRFCSARYFAHHDPADCEGRTMTFSEPGAFKKAEAWAATFDGHPDEPGRIPESK